MRDTYEFYCGLRPTSHCIAILIANQNAPNELLLHSQSSRRSRPSPSYYNLGAACHGETVNDVAFCETRWKNKTLLLSGSNDCTAKLYAVEGNKMPHESCIRAVCCCISSLLVVSGGKLLSTFYRLDEKDDGTYKVTFLCTNRLQEKPALTNE